MFTEYENFIRKNYTFIPGMDQVGHDIHHCKDHKELLKYIISNHEKQMDYKTIVAFNTLGFVKNKIEFLTPSTLYSSPNEGIYIHKKYYEELNCYKKKVSPTDLCKIMSKSDKSPFYTNKPAHAYTPIYNKLFSSFKNDSILFAEIGILNGESILGWEAYFPNALIYGYDNNKEVISKVRNITQKRTIIDEIDVSDKMSIYKAFDDKYFDFIIDDSSHIFEHQINIINVCSKFTEKILIIEDINMLFTKDKFFDNLDDYVLDNFNITFVEPVVNDMHNDKNDNKMMILSRKMRL